MGRLHFHDKYSERERYANEKVKFFLFTTPNQYPVCSIKNTENFGGKIFAKKPLFAILVAQKERKSWGNEYIWA